MKHLSRYEFGSEQKYNRKGLSYLLMRKNPDKIIIPYLKRIKGEDILEVGIGYGYYKDAYFSDNNVTGYDANPELGRNLGIKIISGKADEIEKINIKYNRILSFYMTEYLNPEELQRFIDSSLNILLEDGVLATTIIVRKGLGKLYTRLASIKGIKKYSYSYTEIKSIVYGRNYKLIPLNTYFGIPMSVLLEIRK